jgi:disulfide bond formation protein DsbB
MRTVHSSGRARALFAFIAVASLGVVGMALVSQHVFNMQPCPWCILMRLIFLVLATLGLLGLLLSRLGFVRRLLAGLGVVGALSGIASALWLYFVAASSTSCNLTLADRIISGLGLDALLPEVFEARASCADAAVSMLGLPYALWALTMFVLLAAASVAAWRAD